MGLEQWPTSIIKITFEDQHWMFMAKEKQTCKQIINKRLAQGQRKYRIAGQ
jgi:hypothetical protein